MSKPLDLKVTSADMDRFWDVVNKARDDLSVVKLSRKQLCTLLLDHGKLLNYYEGKPQ
jgi:acid phosphatase class B